MTVVSLRAATAATADVLWRRLMLLWWLVGRQGWFIVAMPRWLLFLLVLMLLLLMLQMLLVLLLMLWLVLLLQRLLLPVVVTISSTAVSLAQPALQEAGTEQRCDWGWGRLILKVLHQLFPSWTYL